MARPLRIEFPCAFHHVSSQGHSREDTFVDETNSATFLGVYVQESQQSTFARL